MVLLVEGSGTVGRGCPDVRDFRNISSPGSSIICIRDMGEVSTHWEDAGRI